MEITGNLRYISDVQQYIVDGNDGTINVDTSVYAVTIVLPNINNSGYANTSKGFIINDISGNASINNITIIANSNSVNSVSSVIISVDGGTAKCSVANSNEWFVITEPQSGGNVNPLIISITYDDLVNFINTSQLIRGQKYILKDFQTIYDQPDYDAGGLPKIPIVTNTGETEPLIFEAISTTEISSTVLSTVYPYDRIQYDWTFNQTELGFVAAKGRITERITSDTATSNNNRTSYDHRAVVFKRYYNPLTTLYTVINDNGELYIDTIPTFGKSCNNVYLGEVFSGFNINVPLFIVPNNIFESNCTNINIAGNFYNNTIGANCSNCVFGYFCQNNVIGNNFIDNKILNLFSNNTIGSNFTQNTILNNFTQNTINVNSLVGEFLSNTIQNNFQNNLIEHTSFKNNNILDYFENNNIINGGGSKNNSFSYNNIGKLFTGNYITNDFASNTINNNFQLNSVLYGNFSNNEILDNFNNNSEIGNTFTGNKIGNNFQYNSIIGKSFENNFIGNLFSNNLNIGESFSNNNIGNAFFANDTIGDFFNNNQIQNYFQNNLMIGNNFQGNVIGNNFEQNQNIDYEFSNNHIGNNFQQNKDINHQFANNTINNNFQGNNTIGIKFGNNFIASGFSNNINILDGFNSNNITASVTALDFALSTYVYNGFTKNIFRGNGLPLSFIYLEYFDQVSLNWVNVTPINS